MQIYFGGGSVALATPEGCWHIAKCDPGAALTDGTPNFLGAAALTLAYDNWDSRGGIKVGPRCVVNFTVKFAVLQKWLGSLACWRTAQSVHA